MQKEREAYVEQFFLDNFSTEALFRNIERQDYIFLYNIKKCVENTAEQDRVYLSDLAESMNMKMPDVSESVKRLQEKGLVFWNLDNAQGKTYVSLTEKAVERMNNSHEQMKKCYAKITSEVNAGELEQMVQTMRKVSGIIKDMQGREP